MVSCKITEATGRLSKRLKASVIESSRLPSPQSSFPLGLFLQPSQGPVHCTASFPSRVRPPTESKDCRSGQAASACPCSPSLAPRHSHSEPGVEGSRAPLGKLQLNATVGPSTGSPPHPMSLVSCSPVMFTGSDFLITSFASFQKL